MMKATLIRVHSALARRSKYVSFSLGALAAAIVLLAGGTASARAASCTPRNSHTCSLRVWAYMDGDIPVAGGHVHVYAGGRPLRVDGPTGSDRTFAEGTALLQFSSLPRNLRVVVSGGRAGGKLLRGSLTAEVRGGADGTLVEVNPISTLADAWAAAAPGRSLGRGHTVIDALLGIPQILDDEDLRATDRWFDGATFERWAMAQGSIDAGVAALVRYVDAPSHHRRLFHAPFTARTAASAGSFDKLVDKGFEAALGGLFDLLAKIGPAAGPQGVVFGLAMKGLKTAILAGVAANKEKEEDEVKVALAGISKRIAELKVQLGNSVFQLQVEALRKELAKIEVAQRDLDWALSLPLSTEQGRSDFGEAARQFLKSAGDLRGISLLLHKALTETQPEGAPALIPGVRRKLGAERFFTHQSSLRIRRFFDYYGWAQTRLAELLSEYHTYRNETATATQRVKEIAQEFLPLQRKLLPPRDLPSVVFIDTNSKLMWGVEPAFRYGKQLAGSGFSKCGSVFLKPGAKDCVLNSKAQFAGFGDWRMPTADQAEGLFSDRGETDPLTWLATVGVQFNPRYSQLGVLLWLGDKFTVIEYKGRYIFSPKTEAIDAKLLVLKPGRGSEGSKPFALHSVRIAFNCTLANPPSCKTLYGEPGGFILWVRPTTERERAQYW